MTTTERNDLLRLALMRFYGALGGYTLNDVNASADAVTLSVALEGRWENWEYAHITFTFDELCDPAFAADLHPILVQRFDEAVRAEKAELDRLAKEREAAEKAEKARIAAIPKLTRKERDLKELARLKALYPES